MHGTNVQSMHADYYLFIYTELNILAIEQETAASTWHINICIPICDAIICSLLIENIINFK
jgi:hypothetical protein